VPWSLLQVVNWHFVAADRSYSDAFAAPSPLEHYWSLAIEQQFYLLFPLVALAVLRAGPSRRPARHRVRNLALVLAVLAAGSLAVNGLLADGSVDRAYFGSDTRLAELLVGALLATATVRRLRLPSPAARRLAGAAGIAGLAASAWLWHSAPLRAEWMYPWGFLATAVCSAALVLGAAQPGPLSTVLGSAPLRALGRISYGVYLVHWPVFLLLTPRGPVGTTCRCSRCGSRSRWSSRPPCSGWSRTRCAAARGSAGAGRCPWPAPPPWRSSPASWS